MTFDVFGSALAVLVALLGGLAGRHLARDRSMAAWLAAGLGAAAALLIHLLLAAYFGSPFIGLLVLAAFVLFL
ncbi:hypothetical protein [Bosea sp. (in: a-proteobacteria)]|jgi:hypothetical protein|uniref:hypothetical protein n=1 Tax=Bosea sp. (in: a-proteobacteria) TaxID=1871050 RepID=UPI003F6E93F7